MIPNKEIRQIYQEQVLEWLEVKSRADSDNLSALYAALACGNTAVVSAMLNEQLLAAVSFRDAYETFYHGFLLALLNACSDWDASSNVETGHGLCDILVEEKSGRLGMVIEVKRLKELKGENELEQACQAAIKQILANDYAAVLRKSEIKNIWLYGIAFCGKRCAVLAKHLSS